MPCKELSKLHFQIPACAGMTVIPVFNIYKALKHVGNSFHFFQPGPDNF